MALWPPRSTVGCVEGHNYWALSPKGHAVLTTRRTEKLLATALGDYSMVAATSLSVLQIIGVSPRSQPLETIKIDMIKELSVKDAITARALYKSNRTFIPKFKLIIFCNTAIEIPNINAAIVSSSSRLRAHFAPEKITVDAKRRRVRKVTDDYIKENIFSLRYVSECCVEDEDGEINIKSLHSEMKR
ncbi:MAG: hypothetical protein BYD32DRAFT_481167 [Podila humilis]|nr:MAG: hypothetical protein BYD32DRAFT_481167 [Podila humilis]